MQTTGPEGTASISPRTIRRPAASGLGGWAPTVYRRAPRSPGPEPVGGHADRRPVVRLVDICGFTSYCEQSGEQPALELLIEFRQVVRDVVARRGVRVSKWLGDGVMIVSLEPAILAGVRRDRAALLEPGLDTHAGIATGSVLLSRGTTTSAAPSTSRPGSAKRLSSVRS